MPMVPGLNPNIRQLGLVPDDIEVQVAEPEPVPEMDDAGHIIRVEHGDGSVTVSLDGKPIEPVSETEVNRKWFRNLVDDLGDSELSGLAEEILRGIDDDMQSRQDWVEDRSQGLKLLGLKIEVPGIQGASDGAPVEGMSKVRHPLLMEAVLRFQANARSELLPTDGPVKVRNDAVASTPEQEQVAEALEKDLNHYLTAVAREYYPDTDRMLFMLGFGGTAFKKVYFCPLRGRPVSETVDAADLIVNYNATDLSTARRITHRVFMKPSTIKRLQILGVYRDVDLGTPAFAEVDAVAREKADIQGVAADAINPEDRDYEIYECYCELNIPGFEHKHKGKETGLEIPYRVTIDKDSRQILSIVRNYDRPDEEKTALPEARTHFVKYTFVPGLGFYDIGYLHILGNTTNAATALWREMIDAGMFANFPGFLMGDSGARQNTNIFRVPPGGAALVKTNGVPLKDNIMPLPYKEPGQAMFNLIGNIVETGQRVGGTAELAVGEGRQDAPVGTTLAMIDQATKVMNAVHKRLHAAQAEEFQLLVRCFREHPESFWQKCKKPTMLWNEDTFLQALNDCELVPQADPNTSSHAQRLMKVMGLKQLAMASPQMYDIMAVDKAALQALGWNNPEQFFTPPNPNPPPLPPEVQVAMAEVQVKDKDADTKRMKAMADVAKIQSEIGQDPNAAPQLDPNKVADLHLKQAEMQHKRLDLEMKDKELQHKHVEAGLKANEIDADMRAALLKNQDDRLDSYNRRKDRESSERLAVVKLAQDIMKTPNGTQIAGKIISKEMLEKLESEEPVPPSEFRD